MENIVHNFAKITFQPTEVVYTANRAAPNFPAASNNFAWNQKPMSSSAAAMSDENLESESPDTDQSDELDSKQSRAGDNDESDSSCGSSRRRGGVCRRRMPGRVSKDNFNRVCSVIMKTSGKKKRRELHTNEQMLKSIEKIYTSKRMKKFTPANLETIFEEPSDENAADAEDDSEECSITSQVRLVKFGGRKLRRAISFNDGLNKNKNLIKKRRLKVKKTFGKRLALKKISMTEFHDRLNKSLDSAMLEVDEDATGVGGVAIGGGVGLGSSSGGSARTTPRPTSISFMDDMQLLPLARQSAAFE